MADSSGHGQTGAYDSAYATLGQPGPLADDASTAVSDDGDGPVGESEPPLPLGGAPRSLEGWVNTTYNGGTDPIASYGDTDNGEGFEVDVEADAVDVSGGYDTVVTFPTPYAIDDGAWHFIAVTTNGTSATAYLDGVSLGTQDFPQTLDTQATTYGFLVGETLEEQDGGFAGDLADIALFPTALSATQIAAEYSASGDAALRPGDGTLVPHP
jgi:large repetitive protein